MNSLQISSTERKWAMFAHLASFLGWIGIPLANFIAPLVIWQIKKEEMPFAAQQAKECLNFQISLFIYGILLSASALFVAIVTAVTIESLVGLTFIPIVALMLLALFDLILTIIAAIAANDGESYQYPITIRFIK